ncbi:MAG: NAD(P)/FAD-dependent oxidoreductase [bacterium]
MQEIDYIIVGSGLAGIAFIEQLKANDKSFVVYDDASQQSSTVAGGMYNPVVLKRFSKVWKSAIQLQLAAEHYKKVTAQINTQIDYRLPVWRVFNSLEEQNNWFAALDKPNVGLFLNKEIIKTTINGIDAPFGFGEVLQTGWVDTQKLITHYKQWLLEKDHLIQQSFDYDNISFKNDRVIYDHYTARHIVFSEGFGLKKNPYFNHLPLNGTKGELITIHAPELELNQILKSGVFIIPQGDSQFRVGATYNWEDKTNTTSEDALLELTQKLDKVLKVDYKVINQQAGIRPTVKDRRPLVGLHAKYKNLAVLNGLGTRGVMIAPYVAQCLYHYLEDGLPLDAEIDINRFAN